MCFRDGTTTPTTNIGIESRNPILKPYYTNLVSLRYGVFIHKDKLMQNYLKHLV